MIFLIENIDIQNLANIIGGTSDFKEFKELKKFNVFSVRLPKEKENFSKLLQFADKRFKGKPYGMLCQEEDKIYFIITSQFDKFWSCLDNLAESRE